MAYEKQTWVTGEVITKEKLNHIEDGIANSETNVEIIKLGTISNMGGGLVGSNLYNVQGTLSTIDGKNVGEIIGDKTIVSTVFVVDNVPVDTEGIVLIEYSHMVLCIPDATQSSAYRNKELLFCQKEQTVRQSTSLSVHALIASGVNPSGLSASVYAICI